MGPLSIPTDSLYKTLALSGVALVVVCIIFPYSTGTELFNEASDLLSEVGGHRVEFEVRAREVQYWIEDAGELLKTAPAVGDLSNMAATLTDPASSLGYDTLLADRDEAFFGDGYFSFYIIPLLRDAHDIRMLVFEARRTGDIEASGADSLLSRYNLVIDRFGEFATRAARADGVQRSISDKITAAQRIRILTVLGIIVGTGMAVAGFYLWYTRIQVHTDAILIEQRKQADTRKAA